MLGFSSKLLGYTFVVLRIVSKKLMDYASCRIVGD